MTNFCHHSHFFVTNFRHYPHIFVTNLPGTQASGLQSLCPLCAFGFRPLTTFGCTKPPRLSTNFITANDPLPSRCLPAVLIIDSFFPRLPHHIVQIRLATHYRHTIGPGSLRGLTISARTLITNLIPLFSRRKTHKKHFLHNFLAKYLLHCKKSRIFAR